MIKIFYEEYYNDFKRTQKTNTFSDLQQLADWIFEQMQLDYTKETWALFFPTPEILERLHEAGPCRIEFHPYRCGGPTYWIRKIESGEGILFSDGTYTAGQRYWNEEIKKWLRECDHRKKNPTFHFV